MAVMMNIPSAASLAVLAVDGKDRREELVLGGHDSSLAPVTLQPIAVNHHPGLGHF